MQFYRRQKPRDSDKSREDFSVLTFTLIIIFKMLILYMHTHEYDNGFFYTIPNYDLLNSGVLY